MYGWLNQYGMQMQNPYNPQIQNQGNPQMQNQYGQQMPLLQQDQYGGNNPQMMAQPARQPVDERIWVQNEMAATAYLIAPNGFVRLWDASRPVFYEKHADASGKPEMEIYEYHKCQNMEAQPKEPVVQTVTKEEYLDTIGQIDTRLKELEDILKK